jgi:intraflagellar transport protein 80
VTKVEYVQYIRSIPSEEGRQAELALFRRQPDEAERILLQTAPPLVYRAIKMNLNIYRWQRALELAVKYKVHLDTVLGYRQKYLSDFQREETTPKFLQYFKQVNFDWNDILANEEREIEEEGKRVSAGGGGGRYGGGSGRK